LGNLRQSVDGVHQEPDPGDVFRAFSSTSLPASAAAGKSLNAVIN